MNRIRTIMLVLPVLFSGCRLHVYSTPAPGADYYYLNPNRDLNAVARVALIELDNHSNYPEISAEVTEALFQALQKKQVFSLSVVRQNEPSWRGLQVDLNSKYTPEQLSEIGKRLKCRAVLVGTVTEFQPYPHMTIGLRMKLVDLKDGQLLWALEQIWDAADTTTELRIRRYYHSQMRSDSVPLREQLVAVSSIKFIKFVTFEVGETLRERSQKARTLALGASPRLQGEHIRRSNKAWALERPKFAQKNLKFCQEPAKIIVD